MSVLTQCIYSRYNDPDELQYLEECTVMDPRFKWFPSTTEFEDAVYERVASKIREVQDDSTDIPSDEAATSESVIEADAGATGAASAA